MITKTAPTNALLRKNTLSLRLSAVAFALVALGAIAATAGDTTESTVPRDLGPVQWVGELRGPQDVVGRGSWLKRTLRAIVGLETNRWSMLSPYGLHVDAGGRILVADTKLRVVHLFDAKRKKYQAFRAPDSDPFAAPIAIATDASNRIYVSDSVRSRIFIFSPEGKFLRTLGGLDRQESIFKRATGIALNTKLGRLYVVDTVAMRVVLLSLDGKVLGRFGQRGEGPGEFNFPTHIALSSDGSVWVSDSLNFRIQHFDSEGNFLGSFGRLGNRAGDFDKPKGLAVDAAGRVCVVEGRNDRVQCYSPAGELQYVFGATGGGAGEFFLPAGIATDSGGQILVADTYNRRVQIFRENRGGAGTPSSGGN
jgi:DNA-binding beta-propeller fold protein YncE